MGLLDDAIREHLDLKRRRGADPAEIERAEREALGPVRRAPEPQESGEPELSQQMPYDDRVGDAAAHDDDALAWDDVYEDQHDEFEPFDDEPRAAAEPELHEPPPPRAARAPVEAPTQHMPLPHADADEELEEPAGTGTPRPHPAAPLPADDPPAASPHPAERSGGETVEYEVEGEFAGEADQDDDVLEETPEFLQDTPDHDRLWFEQRPPKDFDFDG
jgi:hypothetical protein